MAIKQDFVDSRAQFPAAGYVNGDVPIDPILASIPGDISTTTSEQFMNKAMWHSTLGKRIALFDNGISNARSGGIGEMNVEQIDVPDTETGSTITNRTRLSSLVSTDSPRRRSRASSSSSLPSTKSNSSEMSRTGRSRRQPSPHLRKRMSPSLPLPQHLQQDPKPEEKEEKRDRFLERNRIAASKCRQKKKKWANDLEETKIKLEAQNKLLHQEYNAFIWELGELKNQLMAHTMCEDDKINQWIEYEARRFIQNSTERFESMRIPEAGCSGYYRRGPGSLTQLSIASPRETQFNVAEAT